MGDGSLIVFNLFAILRVDWLLLPKVLEIIIFLTRFKIGGLPERVLLSRLIPFLYVLQHLLTDLTETSRRRAIFCCKYYSLTSLLLRNEPLSRGRGHPFLIEKFYEIQVKINIEKYFQSSCNGNN